MTDASTNQNEFLLGPSPSATSDSDNKDSEDKPVRTVSKKKTLRANPFGEADKHDSHMFYVDIVYVVLHMIGLISISYFD